MFSSVQKVYIQLFFAFVYFGENVKKKKIVEKMTHKILVKWSSGLDYMKIFG